MRFRVEVIVDYYPKNIFLGNIFDYGICKGEILEKFLTKSPVRKLDWVPCSFHKTILISLQNYAEVC